MSRAGPGSVSRGEARPEFPGEAERAEHHEAGRPGGEREGERVRLLPGQRDAQGRTQDSGDADHGAVPADDPPR